MGKSGVDVETKGCQDGCLCDAILEVLLPVVSVKLQLPTSCIFMWTMCLSGSNHSSLQVRPQCHTGS